MQGKILITGSTDGIGLETARFLVSKGHHILLHGRNPSKLEAVKGDLAALPGDGRVEGLVADLSCLSDVEAMASAVAQQHPQLDVLINNAGVFKTSNPRTDDGLDVRFVVNTLAPYLLTRRLLPVLGRDGRVVNLSSAAQAPVQTKALAGNLRLDDMQAYAQSKLALTMWSRQLGLELQGSGPMIVAVNPGSLLATKMVKEGFGVAGSNVQKGVDILVRAALGDEFSDAHGQYFDNDAGRFGSPHRDALDVSACRRVVEAIESELSQRAP